jgi:hypothetical protein
MFSIVLAKIEYLFCHCIHFDYRYIIVSQERKFNFCGNFFPTADSLLSIYLKQNGIRRK